MPSLDQHYIVLHERTIQVRPGLEGTATERGLLGALLRRKIRLRGNPRLLLTFGRCFPS